MIWLIWPANEKRRLKQPYNTPIETEISDVILFLEKKAQDMTNRIEKIVQANEELSQKVELLASVPGIGFLTAATLVGCLPELGHVSDGQISSLIGVAPFEYQSGDYYGRGRIRDGRFEVRKIFYMAVLCATRANAAIKKSYNNLRQRGKAAKVALVACMRKMIIILNTMVAKNETWNYPV